MPKYVLIIIHSHSFNTSAFSEEKISRRAYNVHAGPEERFLLPYHLKTGEEVELGGSKPNANICR